MKEKKNRTAEERGYTLFKEKERKKKDCLHGVAKVKWQDVKFKVESCSNNSVMNSLSH